MSEEERELLNRISQISDRIKRHKNRQAGLGNQLQPQQRYNPYRGRGSSSYRAGRLSAPHRNRSLILNNVSASASSHDAEDGGADDASPPSWVTKSDRHLQLISKSVFEQKSQDRSNAIEETRKRMLRMRDDKEKSTLMNHFRNSSVTPVSADSSPNPNVFEIDVQGIRFRVTRNGSKLVKIPGLITSGNSTPKVASIGGIKFYRSKSGNLYRDGVVKAQRHSDLVKKIDEPCRAFSSSGSCPKGPRCRYAHDHQKVALCKDYMLKGNCGNGDACDLSHDPTPERSPNCLHFARGNCTNINCLYTHSNVSPGAPVCRSFGIYGYCPNGAQCGERHVSECPDFSNTGSCKTKGCKLPHRERASVLRKREPAGDDDSIMDDLSSDDESVDSDDVDSDEVEEFIGADAGDDDDFLEKDFIPFKHTGR